MEPTSRLAAAHKVLTARTGTRRSFGFSIERTALPITIIFPICDFESQVLQQVLVLNFAQRACHAPFPLLFFAYFSKHNFLYTYKLEPPKEGSGSLLNFAEISWGFYFSNGSLIWQKLRGGRNQELLGTHDYPPTKSFKSAVVFSESPQHQPYVLL